MDAGRILIEVIGWAGSLLLIVSILQTRLLRLRRLNLVACLVLIVYNALIGVWPGVAMNVALGVINAVYLIRARRETTVPAPEQVPGD